MDDQLLIENLNDTMEMSIPANSNFEKLHQFLSQYVHQLIATDLHKLLNLLYRIDVSEEKLNDMLVKNDKAGAGSIIADLIIERQLQKIKTRQQFRKEVNDIDEKERF
jgi:hypothetical protein